jgi:hypothetical protein
MLSVGDPKNLFDALLNPSEDLIHHPYITRVREALWTLNDYMSHLSNSDLVDIFVSVYKDEREPMDRIIKSEIDKALGGNKALLAMLPGRISQKLRPGRPGWD